MPEIDPGARYTFGGSGALETDIEQGAPADVFAAASPKQPAQLYTKGLVDTPREFATNTLVIIVPKGNPAHITSVGDITRPGVKLVICNATVPCGDYARKVFANLGIARAAMKNVVSQTTDVTQTVADVALGQADAGFVYITDAKAANGRVAVVRLPARPSPRPPDYIAVVRSGKNRAGPRRSSPRSCPRPGRPSSGPPGSARRERARPSGTGTLPGRAAGVALGARPGRGRGRRVARRRRRPGVPDAADRRVGDLSADRQPVHGFDSSVATDAIVVSLQTNLIALAIMLVVGTPFAYILARKRFRGRSLVIYHRRGAAGDAASRRRTRPCWWHSAGSGCWAARWARSASTSPLPRRPW